MNRFILAAAFALSAITAFGQTIVLKGNVLHGKEPIPYVNIGIKKKGIGTAATINGTFTLSLPQTSLTDTLTFSAVGFNELSVPIKTIVNDRLAEFKLTEKTTSLREVVVKSKSAKIKKFGTTLRHPFIYGVSHNSDTNDISEFAKLIEINNKPSDVLSTSLYLTSSKIDSANMRINFYRNVDGMPGERIAEKSIIKRLPLKEGWVTVNLQDYNITVDEDFFIGFEYLPDPSHKEKYLFAFGAVFGGSYFTRKVSLGEWNKGVGGKLSAYVTVRQ
ncbi:carboxypeptidase-like regulatory domain-containing protein [Pontibacter sp. Tf4]|uniref:carboxypeptidase-like regulatory domain-containing protein n=1 Tax=Pontibacter sp. Tf4 TaxID=2761620 RepID=UPI001625DF48|nr:carboxypeptidase-like regulatory domain-containing protein [Pontibacter sp. Tf4]MBB6611109.1 carboxypeptidase-like regulatory domain-containing protein [Pontibacter sp. Tf4]